MLCCTQGVNAILIVGHRDTEKVYHQHHIPCKIETTLLKLKQQQMQLGSYCELEVDGYTDFVFINRYGNVLLPHDINRAIVRIYTEANAKEAEQAKKNAVPLLLSDTFPFTTSDTHSVRAFVKWKTTSS